jgi:hypothetical protein
MRDDEVPVVPEVPGAGSRRSPGVRRGAIIAIVAVVLAGLWLVTLVPGWLSRSPEQAVSAPAGAGAADSERRIQATLFYVSDDGADLIPVVRQVPYGATPADQARQIAIAQVRQPTDGRISAIPVQASVRTVYLDANGAAYVDLTLAATAAPYFSGSLDETLAVYAIVNALTTNLPDVKSVQILVDGKEVDSLAGHIDLREPIARSDAWVRKGQ